MEFPNEIKQYILSYLPHPYKKPLHLTAINTTPMFADFTIDRQMAMEVSQEIGIIPGYKWFDSYVEYKKWRHENRYIFNRAE